MMLEGDFLGDWDVPDSERRRRTMAPLQGQWLWYFVQEFVAAYFFPLASRPSI